MTERAIDKEIWFFVEGYSHRYSISNMGNLKSHVYNLPRLMYGCDINGYRRVQLFTADGKHENIMLHRIVAKHFCDGYSPELDVNHKDGNRGNNTALNLEWVTRKENINHAFRNGFMKISKGEKCGRSKLTEKEVLEIRKLYTPNKKGSVQKSSPPTKQRSPRRGWRMNP